MENKTQLYTYKMTVVKEESAAYLIENQISKSLDAYNVLSKIYKLEDILISEQFHILFLNNSNKLIGTTMLSQGGMTGTVVDIKLLMRNALLMGSNGIMLAHNHPSGKLKPSDSDIQITKKIKEACKIMDIALLDHLIITEFDYYSFADNGIL